MPTGLIPSWQKRRSAFNHDWLKNQFMPAVATFLNLLDDRIENDKLEKSFVLSVFSEWGSHREEALSLPRYFEREMSPRSLFDRPPLSRCDKHTKQWLGDLVHCLWVTRYPVNNWVTDACAHAKAADGAYERLKQSLKACADTQSASALRPFRKQFAEFRERCQDLAKAVEKFPSEVRVT